MNFLHNRRTVAGTALVIIFLITLSVLSFRMRRFDHPVVGLETVGNSTLGVSQVQTLQLVTNP